MEFNDYQLGALETAQYPNNSTEGTILEDTDTGLVLTNIDHKTNFVYPALGLVGEAGEVAEKIKKIIRDKKGWWDETDQKGLKKELGDVLWYVAVLAHEFAIKLDDIATTNYDKLKSRKERNMISGSGDNR